MSKQKSSGSTRTWLLYVMVVVLVAAGATLIYRIVDSNKTNNNKSGALSVSSLSELSGEVGEQIKEAEERIESTKNTINVNSFNNKFEYRAGRQSGSATEDLMTDIITNNKKNADYQISVIFDGEDCGTDVTCIATKKDTVVVWHGSNLAYYEVSFEYNEAGYIYQTTITTKE